MAALVPYKRPVVLSLGELERYPTTTDRYAVTLPFNNDNESFVNPLNCSCDLAYWGDVCEGCDLSILFAKVKAKAIKQTEKRWAWFSEARRMDDSRGTRLGTLGFLPPEIRYKIWVAVVEEYKDTRYTEMNEYRFWRAERMETRVIGTLEFEASHDEISWRDIFDLKSYDNWYRENLEGNTTGLRYASAQAKIELENTFVFTNAFRFSCPKHLDHFLNQLSAYQESLLRFITIRLFGCGDCWHSEHGVDFAPSSNTPSCRAWIAIIERLPATLKSISFELGVSGIQLAIRRFSRSRSSREIDSANIAVKLLEFMTKKIQRQAPGVNISISDLDDLFDEDRESFQAMLDEVSPYSKDFMRWWDESRKNAVDGGQGH